jgi:hypothetical protein
VCFFANQQYLNHDVNIDEQVGIVEFFVDESIFESKSATRIEESEKQIPLSRAVQGIKYVSIKLKHRQMSKLHFKKSKFLADIFMDPD